MNPLKRSFVRLPVTLDAAALIAELEALPTWVWERTHWPYPHGSVEQLLLRGGETGTESDFWDPTSVANHAILDSMPRHAELIGPDGPFGGATFAFLFRMAPAGRSRLHTDDAPVWSTHHRIHVPLVTNPGALLVAEGRARHLPVGEAWTFDNQGLHGALNGTTPRTHLILDVPIGTPQMADLLTRGTFDPGRPLTAADPPLD